MNHNQERGFATVSVVALLMTVAFIIALVFGIWAFVGMQENQTNLDAKIEAASAKAVEVAEAAKDAEFAEREKSPFEVYIGPAVYGSLSFEYPKTWSVYAEEDTSGTVLEIYAHPNVIPGLDRDIAFAFRGQILSSSYDAELKKFENAVEGGEVRSAAFQLAKVPTEVGSMLTGEIEREKQGKMLLLPQRDKTIRLWTESVDFVGDFDRLIETATYVP